MRREQIAINSVSTGGVGLEERLAAYSAAGFENVELMLGHVKDFLAQGRTMADVRRLLDRYTLRCIGGFQMGLEAFSPADKRAENHAKIIENAKLVRDLGGTKLVVGTDGPTSPVADPAGELARAFAEVADRICETGVDLCLEFNWSPLVKSLRMAADVARRAERQNVGVLFDPAHYYCTPTKIEELTRENVATIKHIHVDDMRDKPAELSNCNTDRVLPGKGVLDLKAIFGRIEEHGYRGYFSIEMFDDELRSLPAEKAARLMYESLLPYTIEGA